MHTHICIVIDIYTHVHVCIHMCTHVQVCINTDIDICVYMYIRAYTCTHVCMHICAYACIYACMYMHVCVCAYMHIHTYIHTLRHVHTYTGTRRHLNSLGYTHIYSHANSVWSVHGLGLAKRNRPLSVIPSCSHWTPKGMTQAALEGQSPRAGDFPVRCPATGNCPVLPGGISPLSCVGGTLWRML